MDITTAAAGHHQACIATLDEIWFDEQTNISLSSSRNSNSHTMQGMPVM